jgi:putative aldouronate transport system permease protein
MDAVIAAIVAGVCVLMVYPFLYCLAYSLSDSTAVMNRIVGILPVQPTLSNYTAVLMSEKILLSSFVTASRTAVGVVFGVGVTGLASYAVSKKAFRGRRALTFFLIIPMYVSGGLLPYYVVIHSLGLFNNFLVYILPNGFWALNMLIMRTYFESLPPSLEESARLDGAGELRVLASVVAPLSMPIIATVAIFLGVAQWNSWFDAAVFVTRQSLHPLQLVLQKMLIEASTLDLRSKAMHAGNRRSSTESMRMATLIITTAPIVVIYPFFQRYFIKGVMIGAVKA